MGFLPFGCVNIWWVHVNPRTINVSYSPLLSVLNNKNTPGRWRGGGGGGGGDGHFG